MSDLDDDQTEQGPSTEELETLLGKLGRLGRLDETNVRRFPELLRVSSVREGARGQDPTDAERAKAVVQLINEGIGALPDDVDRWIAEAVLASVPPYFGIRNVEARRGELMSLHAVSDDMYRTRRPHVIRQIATFLKRTSRTPPALGPQSPATHLAGSILAMHSAMRVAVVVRLTSKWQYDPDGAVHEQALASTCVLDVLASKIMLELTRFSVARAQLASEWDVDPTLAKGVGTKLQKILTEVEWSALVTEAELRILRRLLMDNPHLECGDLLEYMNDTGLLSEARVRWVDALRDGTRAPPHARVFDLLRQLIPIFQPLLDMQPALVHREGMFGGKCYGEFVAIKTWLFLSRYGNELDDNERRLALMDAEWHVARASRFMPIEEGQGEYLTWLVGPE